MSFTQQPGTFQFQPSSQFQQYTPQQNQQVGQVSQRTPTGHTQTINHDGTVTQTTPAGYTQTTPTGYTQTTSQFGNTQSVTQVPTVSQNSSVLTPTRNIVGSNGRAGFGNVTGQTPTNLRSSSPQNQLTSSFQLSQTPITQAPNQQVTFTQPSSLQSPIMNYNPTPPSIIPTQQTINKSDMQAIDQSSVKYRQLSLDDKINLMLTKLDQLTELLSRR